jgi:hypothetical protein
VQLLEQRNGRAGVELLAVHWRRRIMREHHAALGVARADLNTNLSYR